MLFAGDGCLLFAVMRLMFVVCLLFAGLVLVAVCCLRSVV